MVTVNCTFKIEDCDLTDFERYLRQTLDVIDFRIIPNTSELYAKDNTFRKLVKKYNEARLEKDRYINEHN